MHRKLQTTKAESLLQSIRVHPLVNTFVSIEKEQITIIICFFQLFLASKTVMKIISVTDKIVATMAGGAADCQYWTRVLAKYCA
jgi:20S proteasome alpha/beta subunit